MDIKFINKQANCSRMDRIKLYQVLVHFLLSIGTTNENTVILDSNWKNLRKLYTFLPEYVFTEWKTF